MTDATTLETKLADLKLFQNVLIDSTRKLMAATNDNTIRERLEGMISSDRGNLSSIEQAISQLGSTAESRDITQKKRRNGWSDDRWLRTQPL